MAKARLSYDIRNPDAPVFVISVAAQLSGMHPQTLRSYDRMGLVSPGRAGGGGRRYSLHDIELLRVVAQLTAAGIGIEGVRRILELENQVVALRARVSELEAELLQAVSTPPRAGLPAVRAADALARYQPSLFPPPVSRPTPRG
jgi:MerR family transcriptional regulator/heat shock protein HspR